MTPTTSHHTPQSDGGHFTLKADGHTLATLSYTLTTPALADFYSTHVHPDHGGQGLGTKVLLEGLSWARAQGIKITPTCSFVAHFFETHPEHRDLRA